MKSKYAAVKKGAGAAASKNAGKGIITLVPAFSCVCLGNYEFENGNCRQKEGRS